MRVPVVSVPVATPVVPPLLPTRDRGGPTGQGGQRRHQARIKVQCLEHLSRQFNERRFAQCRQFNGRQCPSESSRRRCQSQFDFLDRANYIRTLIGNITCVEAVFLSAVFTVDSD